MGETPAAKQFDAWLAVFNKGDREFSNPRGVVVRGVGDHFDAFSAPYAKAAALGAAALGG
jgi:hypothetical protein